jgi:AcrR family transcriptional regulator
MTFQRARSDEQRAERRRAILATAETMLTEMPVAQLSLNELSRRVGLAKSNVLNYFESREAVLLELVDTGTAAWVQSLADGLATVDPAASVADRGERLTAVVVETLKARPVLCDLVSAQAAVLEHNISAEMALTFKRATVAHFRRMIEVVSGALPELGEEGAAQFISTAALLAGAIWSHACAGPAIRAAYETDPSLAALRIEFEPAMTRSLQALLNGLLPR